VAAGVLLLIGFVCGYGVRALISHLRHAKARRRHFERLVEETAQARKLTAAKPEGHLGRSRPPGGASIMIIVVTALLIGLLIGFVCGYGVRERISRRRREEYRRRHPARYG
jgi:NhaP-type Na+/H+ or K+/H+ antiporter